MTRVVPPLHQGAALVMSIPTATSRVPLARAEQHALTRLPDQPVTEEALRTFWRLGPHAGRRVLHRALHSGTLHIHSFLPELRYSRRPPRSRPRLPPLWAEPLRQVQGPMSYAQLRAAWGVSDAHLKRMLVHYLALGVLVRASRGVYVRPEEMDPTRPLPTRHTLDGYHHPRPQQAAALRASRLAAVNWPARLDEIARVWDLNTNAANTYLHRLVKQGLLVRSADGLYQRPAPPTAPCPTEVSS